MIRGLYTSASGMMAEMVRNDVTSNNLANVNTTGYKKDTAVFRAFPEMLIHRVNDSKAGETNPAPVIGSLGTGAIVDEIFTSHEQGPLKESTNPFDMAIMGDGYFTVQNPNGTYYTRNGSFTVDSQGYLVNSNGDYLLGQTGPIQLTDADNTSIDESGNVIVKTRTVDQNNNPTETDTVVDTIRLVTMPDPNAARKIGDSLFETDQVQPGNQVRVKQKFLEASNVNVVNEMVNMITVMRAYEANQKVITAHDQTLGQAIEIGRVK